MNALSVFSFQENHPVRVVLVNGEPWFVAKDICDALKLVNSRKALSSLDDDEKNTVTLSDGNRGNPNMSIISESGLYTLILRCRDAVKQGTTAWRFRKWVTNEVLPAIRKSGEYSYVEPAPKSAGEPLDWRQKEELRGLINDIAQSFRYHNAWKSGVWLALRRACRNPSPNPITVDDLPAITAELRRILTSQKPRWTICGPTSGNFCVRWFVGRVGVCRERNYQSSTLAQRWRRCCQRISSWPSINWRPYPQN
ncbi:BRO-N domain-containing protein [Klebsiella michiganensis]|uniref:BRO-N domain-containing protein n=1 Tax=Klebsiella michiganensis TaxID=1134687 RepID=UPI000A45FA24|nr:Bro-N domain-containing protein [Klebsiella michiganensis]